MRTKAILSAAVFSVTLIPAARGQILWTTAADFGGSTYATGQSGWYGWDLASTNGEFVTFTPTDIDSAATNGLGDIGNAGLTSPGGALTINQYLGGNDTVTSRNIINGSTAAVATFTNALTQSGSDRGFLTIDFTSPLGGTTLNAASALQLQFQLTSNNAPFSSGYVNPAIGTLASPDGGITGDAPGSFTVNHGSYFTAFIPYTLAGGPTQNPFSFLTFGVNINSDPSGPYANVGNVTIDAIATQPLHNAYAIWNSATGGSWSSASNWSALGVPGSGFGVAGGDMASFLAPTSFNQGIHSPATITLDAARTLGNINFNSTNSYTLSPGTAGLIALSNGNSSANITDTLGQHTISAPVILSSAATVTTTHSSDSVTLSGGIRGPGALTVSGPGTLIVKGGANTLAGLTVATGSTLDLTNGSLRVTVPLNTGGPTNALIADIVSGYNNGTWTGTGITSSIAAVNPTKFHLGYIDGAIDSNTSVPANQVLVAYCLSGDANLDGSVGFSDLVVVAQNFGKTGKDWAGGNFTYDPNGSVGFADLVQVAQLFGMSSPIASSAASAGSISPLWQATAVVPEPGSAALAIAAAGLLARRRRNFSDWSE